MLFRLRMSANLIWMLSHLALLALFMPKAVHRALYAYGDNKSTELYRWAHEID